MRESQDVLRAAKALHLPQVSPIGGKTIVTFSKDEMVSIEHWLKDHPPIDEAIAAAHLAIDEYYNGDRVWAGRWLLRAHEANQKEAAK